MATAHRVKNVGSLATSISAWGRAEHVRTARFGPYRRRPSVRPGPYRRRGPSVPARTAAAVRPSLPVPPLLSIPARTCVEGHDVSRCRSAVRSAALAARPTAAGTRHSRALRRGSTCSEAGALVRGQHRQRRPPRAPHWPAPRALPVAEGPAQPRWWSRSWRCARDLPPEPAQNRAVRRTFWQKRRECDRFGRDSARASRSDRMSVPAAEDSGAGSANINWSQQPVIEHKIGLHRNGSLRFTRKTVEHPLCPHVSRSALCGPARKSSLFRDILTKGFRVPTNWHQFYPSSWLHCDLCSFRG